MAQDLIDLILTDHQRIRALFQQLRTECECEILNEEKCLEVFRTLKAYIVAHSKAEEFSLYALCENSQSADHQPLKHFIFEGYEEHDLIDFLMKEMIQAEEITDQWRAQLTVLFELLDHHIEDEEKEFLPEVKKRVDREELNEMCDAYLRDRDEIFAKRRGMRPVLSVAHP
jgi:hemerythrin-like domain-containing protein